MNIDAIERRSIKVPFSGCWIWMGSTTKNGYGTFVINNKHWVVHRYSYTCVNGPIPERMMVCHSCDVPCCANPAHLWLGTPTENLLDAYKKDRRGILTMADKKAVLDAIANKEPHPEIARRFGVSRSCVTWWSMQKARNKVSHVIN